MPRTKATHLLLLLATACVPALAQSTYGAVPGTLNFVQGQATINGQPIPAPTGAQQPRQLQIGEVLTTANGSADVLLAPGALLRIGGNSSVRLVAADADRSEVRLQGGHANVAVNLVRPKNLLLVDMAGGQTQILERGLYDFNAANEAVRVFNGEANAYPGAATDSDVKPVRIKEQHEVVLNGNRPHPEKFDRELAQSDLLPWNGPQETNAALANAVVTDNGSSYGDRSGSYRGGYGFSGYGGYDPFYAWGYPYGFYGYPYGFYGAPYGLGLGYFGGFYGGGGYYIGGSRPVLPPRGANAGRGFLPPRTGYASGAAASRSVPSGGMGAVRSGGMSSAGGAHVSGGGHR